MRLNVSKVDVWTATIEDRAGSLAEKLAPLARANLEFIVARRAPDQPGKRVVLVAPLRGSNQVRTAVAAGFQTSDTLHSVRVAGAVQPGLGVKMTQALGGAGVLLQGLTVTSIGRRFVTYLAVDTADDAVKAVGVLKKLS
ncbi:MAG TPA: amino acid-binding protein [Verrucomicrobiae bacterium]|nr:amino acid-binding protein [Verrucomicrobiae bacterium]